MTPTESDTAESSSTVSLDTPSASTPTATSDLPIVTSGPGGALLARLKGGLTKEMGNRLARGSANAFFLNIANVGLGLVTQFVLTRALGKTEYGAYLYVLAWMNVAQLAGRLDFDLVVLRFVGVYSGTQDWSRLHALLRRSRQIVSGASTIVALIGIAIIWILRARIGTAYVSLGMFACALLVATSVLQLTSASLQAFHRVFHSQFPTLVLRPALFAAIVALARFGFGAHTNAKAAVAANLIATVVALAFAARWLRRAVPRAAKTSPPTYATRLWFHAAGGFLLIDLFQTILSSQADVLVVGSFLGTSDAALYGIASQLAAFINFGGVAVSFVVVPLISSLHAQGKRDELQHVLRLAVLGATAFAVPTYLGYLLFGKFVLGLFGPGFVGAYPLLMILGVGGIVGASLAQIAGFILPMTGYQYQASLIIGGSALVNFTLAVILTPLFGAPGTAAATCIGAIVKSLALVIYIWRVLRLRVVPGL